MPTRKRNETIIGIKKSSSHKLRATISRCKNKFTKAPFIQYEQLLLDKNFRQYLETIVVSKKILKMATQKTPIEKTYGLNTGQDSLNIEFLGAIRQLDWIKYL